MNIKALFLSIVLTLCLPISAAFAEETMGDPKYDGIEIVVNVNQASAQEIADLLKGIGLKKAEAIVQYREAQGPFKHIDDLAKVKGIGEATVAKNATRIQL
ncbi:ComEA family DNA-binding protein [Vibrio renipiscarius]|uniref:ComEA family DNA-binding protein n=1 Tax=Vibrio renipiscarius TaxID=1461322 RepID=UPI00354C3CDD